MFTLNLEFFPEAGSDSWRYFVTLPAVQYPVYAVPGRYGHGGLYVLQDRSWEFLSEAGLLAEDQTIQVCAGPRFIKLKTYTGENASHGENATHWPTKFGLHKLGDKNPDLSTVLRRMA